MSHAPRFVTVDTSNWREMSCAPELPHDCAEDVFLDARAEAAMPPALMSHKEAALEWALSVFRLFWAAWQEQEHGHGASRTFGDEAAIRLLQVLTNAKDRKTAMRAECYLAVINRKAESQTDIARKYGVTRAAVSKVIVGIKDDLNLPTARHMKSEAARKSYRARAIRIHTQNKSKQCKQKIPNYYSRLSTLKSSLMPKAAAEN